jgi:hypothetical protein
MSSKRSQAMRGNTNAAGPRSGVAKKRASTAKRVDARLASTAGSTTVRAKRPASKGRVGDAIAVAKQDIGNAASDASSAARKGVRTAKKKSMAAASGAGKLVSRIKSAASSAAKNPKTTKARVSSAASKAKKRVGSAASRLRAAAKKRLS